MVVWQSSTGDCDIPRSIPITEPLTFSSVDSKRAKAGVLRNRPAERAAAEVALGSCDGADVSTRNRAGSTKLTYSTGEACCHHLESF